MYNQKVISEVIRPLKELKEQFTKMSFDRLFHSENMFGIKKKLVGTGSKLGKNKDWFLT